MRWQHVRQKCIESGVHEFRLAGVRDSKLSPLDFSLRIPPRYDVLMFEVSSFGSYGRSSSDSAMAVDVDRRDVAACFEYSCHHAIQSRTSIGISRLKHWVCGSPRQDFRKERKSLKRSALETTLFCHWTAHTCSKKARNAPKQVVPSSDVSPRLTAFIEDESTPQHKPHTNATLQQVKEASLNFQAPILLSRPDA